MNLPTNRAIVTPGSIFPEPMNDDLLVIAGHEQTLRKINARHLQPTERDIDYIVALYDELIRYMDHEVGRLREDGVVA